MRADSASHVMLGDGFARVTAMHVHWLVDFSVSKLRGHVVLHATDDGEISMSDSPKDVQLILDTRDLLVSGVTVDSEVVRFVLDTAATTEALGTPLVITLPPTPATNAKPTRRVIVSYETSLSSSALQWLSPEQTTSKRFPFLFSQCQAIHARSMFPCQDLCQVKVAYTASVVHPTSHTALMSAMKVPALVSLGGLDDAMLSLDVSRWVLEGTGGQSEHGWSVSYFHQPLPIPPYLVAVVVGELDSRSLGPRSTVWAEPSVVDKAQWEFADTEKMIDVAIDRCGAYRWGVFDLLVLPPSFPYGGMENPCLTFVTPTLIAGDRSQTAVVAHELAHSWSGNLVTNASWEHFWINEGLTVFTETKIVEALFGRETAAIRMEEGWQHVHDDMTRFGMEHRFTCLCPRLLPGEDPDDSFSSVPYEKGASLFWNMELVLGASAMKESIREYFDTFALKTITSEGLREFFVRRHPALETGIDWGRWFHEPGMPVYKPPRDEGPVEEAIGLAAEWESSANVAGLVTATQESFCAWPSSKKCVFLNTLSKSRKLSFTTVSVMAEGYSLTTSNAEIRCALLSLWLPLWQDGHDRSPLQLARALVTEQGRMKFTRPTYRAWVLVDPVGAREAFAELQAGYHPICSKMVARDLAV